MPAPVIPTLPDAPQRSDVPSVFVTKADAFVASMQPWGTQINAFGSYINGLALTGVTGPITDTALTVSTGKLLGRSTAGTGAIEELSLSQVLDLIGSAAQGDILYRGASGWARLAAGTSGYVLTAAGAGANPAWAAAASGYTDEQAQDAIASLLQGNGITWTYDDASNTLTAKHTGVAPTTDATTARTASLADAGGWINFTNASAVTFTIPANATVAFPIGTKIDFAQIGAGTVTVAAAGGVTLQGEANAVATKGQFAGAFVKKIGTDAWFVGGNLV